MACQGLRNGKALTSTANAEYADAHSIPAGITDAVTESQCVCLSTGSAGDTVHNSFHKFNQENNM
jgi:hypothetical protein